MPVPTIMSLHTEPQRISCKTATVKSDPPRKARVRVRRSRKTDPALGAQRSSKGGAVVQIPGNRMPLNFQRPLAGAVIDPMAADSEVKRGLASGAEIETVQGKSPNEGLRTAFGRKPCRPDLNRLAARISGATTSPGIQQQIPEPPRTTSLRQSYTKKPDFVTAPRRDRGIDFVQCVQRHAKTPRIKRITTDHNDL